MPQQVTPSNMLNKRALRTRVDLLRPNLTTTVQDKLPSNDRKNLFKVNDSILVRNYHGDKRSQGSIIKLNVGIAIWRRSVDRLLPEPGTRSPHSSLRMQTFTNTEKDPKPGTNEPAPPTPMPRQEPSPCLPWTDPEELLCK